MGLIYLIVFTANILGIFNDPFEFEGDYGQEVNPIRQAVFELVVSKEALTRNLTSQQIKDLLQNDKATDNEIEDTRSNLIKEAILQDEQYGPLLSELVSPVLISLLQEKQQTLPSFSEQDLNELLQFINRYGNERVFRFLRNNPPELLKLDKTLRDKASQEGRDFDLPILSSSAILQGDNELELKKNLLNSVFTEETLSLTKPKESISVALSQLREDFLKDLLGKDAMTEDLQVFSSAAGQAFFFWLYHSLNLHLISQNPGLIENVNFVKKQFAETLGNSQKRAEIFKEKLLKANAGILFTQESDTLIPSLLTQDGSFLPIQQQNPSDGTFVLLRSDLWEPNYEIIPLSGYEGYHEGKISIILATRKESGEKFLLASGHGHSTKAEDGRLQITLIVDKFHELQKQYPNLQLLIGIDANTKSDDDVRLFREHLNSLGLVATNVGPTTIKQRMVTSQNSKSGRFAIDEEDYVITLKNGMFVFANPTIGFKVEKPDLNRPLPNLDNQSDHYPVGVQLIPR